MEKALGIFFICAIIGGTILSLIALVREYRWYKAITVRHTGYMEDEK